MTAVHVVVPDGINDPAKPSGGNSYDRRICRGLAAVGWAVNEHAMSGTWPQPDASARASVTGLIAGIPDDAVVLLDGLIASTVPEVLVPEASRLRLVVLVHMPLGAPPDLPLEAQPGVGLADAQVADVQASERAVLSAAVAIVTTSSWTERWLVDRYDVPPSRVHVAEPGADAADLATGTASGGELLCVAAVMPAKGQDVLLAALADVRDLSWRCVCVGDLSRDTPFVSSLRAQVSKSGLDGRVLFTGPQSADELPSAYAAADVLVLASRAETYGMVVTEALARGLPVVATAVGGLPQALGRGADGTRPGLLVPPGDTSAFAVALRSWLVDADLRRRLCVAARERRGSLPGWSTTTTRLSRILAEAAA